MMIQKDRKERMMYDEVFEKCVSEIVEFFDGAEETKIIRALVYRLQASGVLVKELPKE
jgi:predicted RNA-binding protein (virulence factor B family)